METRLLIGAAESTAHRPLTVAETDEEKEKAAQVLATADGLPDAVTYTVDRIVNLVDLPRMCGKKNLIFNSCSVRSSKGYNQKVIHFLAMHLDPDKVATEKHGVGEAQVWWLQIAIKHGFFDTALALRDLLVHRAGCR
jgi:hypothetical protein